MALKSQNFGILASISWNSNSWQDLLTEEDINNSNFKWVKENRRSFDDLNFGHEKYQADNDGYYIGHSSQFIPPPIYENSKNVEIVFFKSYNYQDKTNYIIGFYAFPKFGNFKQSPDHTLYAHIPSGNIKAKKENITLLENPVNLKTATGILPVGRQMGKMGFNYLKYNNALKILDQISSSNPNNSLVKKIKFEFLTKKEFLALK